MPIEAIKLSPKKNGKGYISSYSISISNKEVQHCFPSSKHIIKLIDYDRAEITIKAKEFTITNEMLERIAQLKKIESEEASRTDNMFHADCKVRTMPEMVSFFLHEHTGTVERLAYKELEQFLLALTMENLVDLTLMMYLGRDMDCNMNMQPGEERFLEFYSRYNDIVCGKSKETLVDIMLEKSPLLIYLRTGYRLIYAPVGSSIESMCYI